MEQARVRVELSYDGVFFAVDEDQNTATLLETDAEFQRSYAKKLIESQGANLQEQVQDVEVKIMPSVERAEVSASEVESTSSFRWNTPATKLLLTLRLAMDAEFRKPTCKKSKLWETIAKKMEKDGHYKGLIGSLCDKKWRNVLATYRRIKECNKTDGQRCTWKFFDMIDKCLGQKASFSPPRTSISSSQPLTCSAKPQPTMTSSSNSLVYRASSAKKQQHTDAPPRWFQEYVKEQRLEDRRRREEEQLRWEQQKELEQQKIKAILDLNISINRLIAEK